MRNLAKLQRICYLTLCCYVVVKVFKDFQYILASQGRHDRTGAGKSRSLDSLNVGVNSTKTYLLALFTTLPSRDQNDNITRAVIRNWASLASAIQPYLFYLPGQDDVVNLAVSRGWRTLPVPKKNKYSVPYLKDMYRVMADSCSSAFIGYSNGDILYDSGLQETLKTVEGSLDVLDPVLVIGRRTTVDASRWDMISGSVDDVSRLARSGVLDRADAEDYFLVTRRFPWRLFPNLVVGRKGYDNFIVARSIDNNISVVDATESITSVHLRRTSRLGSRTKADILFNKYKLINKFDYMKAMTISAPYYTSTNRGKVVLSKRKYDKRFKDVRWS
ncbi:hypothetical protein LSH36_50g00047 [Paralvinella palmiformis]|uniref:Uncharacterized protein n=1 Tax=Paralvinella palmiformis TaxID=53620 RepID=A0AAD9K5N8_9ANNE|nr:hypothetical protein LSH36_50g00047 [Paralvinella palmiformis]